MKKLIITLGLIILSLLVVVQCSSAAYFTNATDKTIAQANAGEYYHTGMTLDVFGSGRTSDLQKARAGIGLGVGYYFNQNMGISGEIIQENFSHNTVDELNVLFRYRIPIGPGPTSLGVLAGVGRDFFIGEYNIQIGAEIVRMLNARLGVVGGARMVKTFDRDVAALGTLGLRWNW